MDSMRRVSPASKGESTPLQSEIVPNLPLSGKELAEIIKADIAARIDSDGMFTAYVGYGRVTYEVVVKMHLDNFSYPEHEVRTRTRPTDKVEGVPPLKDPSEDAVELELERSRKIDSPNATRLEMGMPVKVTSMQAGRVVERELRYAKPDGEPSHKDKTRMKRGGKVVDPETGAPLVENVQQ